MEPQLFDRLQLLTPGCEKYRRILTIFERQTLSGVMARLLTEDDPGNRDRLEQDLREVLNGPE
ncbi:MAG TPA: hypothetical protein VGF28_22225 [Thermoanaerobaculia bacterium]|jgi:hypothetical protein